MNRDNFYQEDDATLELDLDDDIAALEGLDEEFDLGGDITDEPINTEIPATTDELQTDEGIPGPEGELPEGLADLDLPEGEPSGDIGATEIPEDPTVDSGDDPDFVPGYMKERLPDPEVLEGPPSDTPTVSPDAGGAADVSIEIPGGDSAVISIGTDDGPSQNEFDPKELVLIRKVIASEQEATSIYFEAAEETKVPEFRAVFLDNGNEERFHTDILLFAEAQYTGVPYEPRDPEVRKEYEDLVAGGMDEETAFTTAIDKVRLEYANIISENIDTGLILESMDVLEMSVNQYCLTEEILSQAEALRKPEIISEMYTSMMSFVEHFVIDERIFMEEVGTKDVGTFNPLKLLWQMFLGILKMIKSVGLGIRRFMDKIRLRNQENREWIRKYGVKMIFQKKIELYFWRSDPKAGISEPATDTLQNFTITMAQTATKLMQAIDKNTPIIQLPGIGNHKISKLHVPNVKSGMKTIETLRIKKTPIHATDKNKERLADFLFGLNKDQIGIFTDLQVTISSLENIVQAIVNFISIQKKQREGLGQHHKIHKDAFEDYIDDLKTVKTKTLELTKAALHDFNVIAKLNVEVGSGQKPTPITTKAEKPDTTGVGGGRTYQRVTT